MRVQFKVEQKSDLPVVHHVVGQEGLQQQAPLVHRNVVSQVALSAAVTAARPPAPAATAPGTPAVAADTAPAASPAAAVAAAARQPSYPVVPQPWRAN